MNEQKMPRKKSSKAGIYTLLILLLFIVLGLLGFTAFIFIQTSSQLSKLEERLLQGNDAVEDINIKLGDMSKNDDKEVNINSNINTDSSTKSSLNKELQELDKKADNSSSSLGAQAFKKSSFPFTFKYDSDWLLSTADDVQKIGGKDVTAIEANQISLLSPEDAQYIEDALDADASYDSSTINLTYFEDEDISSAVESFYGSSDDAERVEVMTISDFQVEVYQSASGIVPRDDYFVEYDTGIIVVSVSTSRFAEKLINTLK